MDACLRWVAWAFALSMLVAGRPARADDPSWLASPVVLEATRRAVLHAALDDAPLRSLARRVRAAGWIPEVSADVTRGVNANAIVVTSGSDRLGLAETLAFTVRVRFNFDRLMFDGHEAGIERLAALRAEHRLALERTVIDLLARLEVLRLASATHAPGPPAPPDVDARVETARLEVTLEVMTGVEARSLLALAPMHPP